MAERGKSDIDRFLAEIDRLRKKAQGGAVPVARPKPVVARPVEPKPRQRIEMPPGATIPTVSVARSRTDDVPVAWAVPVSGPVIVTPPGSVRIEALEGTVKTVQAAGQTTGKRVNSPFARQLTAVINGKQNVPMAIVLGEIFGPPKSRQG